MVKSGKADKQAAHKARLSAALRENLKRRKQQARDRRLPNRDLPNQGAPDEDAPATPPQETGSVPGFCHNRSDE